MIGSNEISVQNPSVARRGRHGASRVSSISNAIAQAGRCLRNRQHADGHWVGELQGDTILETEYILLMAFLGRAREERVTRLARYVLEQQMPAGGWNNYPGGPAELSTTVKAYFALKLAGHDHRADYMRKARKVIRAMGGAARCNSFTKYYLALLGQIPYANCAAVPPEMIFLPRWAYFNIYAMSSWTRTIVIPLSIFHAYKPVRKLPTELGIRELFLDQPDTIQWTHPPARRMLSWPNFFLALDRVFKYFDPGPPEALHAGTERKGWHCHGERGDNSDVPSSFRRPLALIRRAAVRKAADWMLEHFEDSDGVGAIFPPMIYSVIALRCLGYADDSPEARHAFRKLDDLVIEEGDTARIQPCMSPVWDTAIALNALADVDAPEWNSSLMKAANWLLDKEVRRPGDWSVMNPGLEPAGWFFEHRNGFYPDTDDTAMVLMGLAKILERGQRSEVRGQRSEVRGQRSEVRGQESGVRSQESGVRSQESGVRSQGYFDPPSASPDPTALSVDEARGQAAVLRGVKWLLGMQNQDGGWAAFDRDINRDLLTKIPFADHNAMLDPSCPDITARVLEALGHHGFRSGNAQVEKAITFLRQTQESEGCWIGRWGVNYIYGTWQVLQGLESVGFDMKDPMVRRAVNWLKEVQQPGGAWGESCRSYDNPALKGQGAPTASQTAWALLGLIAAGERNTPEVRAGIHFLLATQEADGNWREESFTGTGFPKVFYLKYHLYSLYFPLMALARFVKGKERRSSRKSENVSSHAR